MSLPIVLDKNNFFNVSWKVILVIFLIVIAFFIIFGLIGRLVEIIMQKQSKAVDHDMANLVISKVTDNPDEFKKIAAFKSRQRFLKASIAPICILTLCLITWIIYGSIIGNFTQNIFNRETGVASLFYELDWTTFKYYPPFGVDWNSLVWIKPEPFTDIRIFNYVIFSLLLIGTIYYLVDVQAYIARQHRIKILAKSIYTVDLSKVDLRTFYNADIKDVKPEQNTK